METKCNIHKVGKYGEKETCIDENNSKMCVWRIFDLLRLHYPINGYTYKIYEDVPMYLPWQRDGGNITEAMRKACIQPDLPTIILQKNDNPLIFYVVLSGDDKSQKTKGNAIERANKNHRAFFEEKMCNNSDIVPYVLFCSGEAFITKKGTTTDYIVECKLKQMMPYGWESNAPHTSFKKKWNQVYLKRERFTYEEKFEILKNIAEESVKYYENYLKSLV